ncbi:hypothetical protein DSO57_1036788 [Entomophthora muscae]|uniref:Uncharacterized protein n=1 Tax=Entomophthora muscae TaxID=34485 RepID=A0ACC2S188_9FUNG|nr:hypothetical protein DSO57_1036788 [Entomophthora muscae]
MKSITLSLVSLAVSQERTCPLKVIVHMGLGTLSHIKPLLEMGTVLRSRNHTVIYAVFDEYEKFNQRYQFRFARLGKFGKDSEQREKMKKHFGGRLVHDPIKQMSNNFAINMPAAYDVVYPALNRVVDEEKPHVLVCDFLSSACRDVAEMKGIPLITGFQSTDIFGIITSPFITSSMTYGSVTTDNLDFIQRFYDKVVIRLKTMYYFNGMTKAVNKARARHGVPLASFPFGDFSTSLGLANTFEGLEAATPLPPYIKMVGPITSDSHTPLTSELTKFLDAHPRTLYIGFGSVIILADFDIYNIMTAASIALKEGSIDGVLWGLGKTNAQDFPERFSIAETEVNREDIFSGKHPHIRLLPWAPQSAILDHKNTQLFISHGGLESTFESMLSGTPVLCMPFFGDQPRNARKLEDAGVGKYVNRLTTTPTTLAREIRYMLNDSSGMISANAKRMRIIAQFGSHRKALGADAIEEYTYAAKVCRPIYPHKYGEVPCELKHLTMTSRDMTFIQANLIDVYGVAILLALTCIFVLGYGLRSLIPKQLPNQPTTIAKKDQ